MDHVVSKMQHGVVLSFEPLPPPSPQYPTAPPALHRMIGVRHNAGWWPIPESFTVGAGAAHLPPRTAQPVVSISTIDSEATVPDGFPCDRYDLEPSPLTQALLQHCKNTNNYNVCWQAFVAGSSGGGQSHLGEPFGHLRGAATNVVRQQRQQQRQR